MARSASKTVSNKRTPVKVPAKSASKLPPLRTAVQKTVAKKTVATKRVAKKPIVKKAALKKSAADVTKRVKGVIGNVVKTAKKAAASAKRKGPVRRTTTKKHTLGQDLKAFAGHAVEAAGAAVAVVTTSVKAAIPQIEEAVGISHDAKK